MARTMKRITAILAILTAAFWLCFWRMGSRWLTPAITASVTLYHFAMRLAVGTAVSALNVRWNARGVWFRSRRWEAPLGRFLRVRRWKRRLPTYDPSLFDLRHHTPEELVQATCQAEFIHELIAALSFLPLFAVRYAGALPVFLITSLLAGAVDLGFALVQRFNRPRLERLLKDRAEQLS